MIRWLILLGCAACGRGFFNPDPQLQDAAVATTDVSTGPLIAYVQSTFDQSSANELQTALPLAQHAGDTLIISVSWYGSMLTSAFDDVGDSYRSAIGPLLGSNSLRHQVFYASAIGGAPPGVNHMHVTFDSATSSSIAIVEYANVDPLAPLDVTVGKVGGSTETPSSGTAVTQFSNELLVTSVIADGAVATMIPGFTLRTQGGSTTFQDLQAPTVGEHAAIAEAAIGTTWICSLIGLRQQ